MDNPDLTTWLIAFAALAGFGVFIATAYVITLTIIISIVKFLTKGR